MRRTIYWNSYEDPNQRHQVVGVEIQPPLSDADLDGIAAELLPPQSENADSKPQGCIAELVRRTRSDEEGSVLIVHPSYLHAPATVPLAIGRLLDPCGVHEIVLDPSLPDVTLESLMPPRPTS